MPDFFFEILQHTLKENVKEKSHAQGPWVELRSKIAHLEQLSDIRVVKLRGLGISCSDIDRY